MIDEDKFIDLVHNNITNNMLICYIVDLFDLDGTLIKNIRELFPHNEILVIGNKYDLFMRSNRPTKLKKYLNDYLDENNIKWKKPIETFEYNWNGKLHKYLPDFYLIDTDEYVEIKGIETKRDIAKWSQFPKKLKVLKRKDLRLLGLKV